MTGQFAEIFSEGRTLGPDLARKPFVFDPRRLKEVFWHLRARSVRDSAIDWLAQGPPVIRALRSLKLIAHRNFTPECAPASSGWRAA